MVLDPSLTAIIAAFAKPLATELAKQLREQLATEDYSSKGPLPAGVTPRTFRSRCARISEARHEGKLWRCPREAWHASFDALPEAQESDAYEILVAKGGAK